MTDLRGQNPIVNGGFEQGEAGAAPQGWRSLAPAYKVSLEEVPHSGARSLQVSSPYGQFNGSGGVEQVLDARPFRGKWVRLRGFVRAAVPAAMSSYANLTLLVQRPRGAGFWDNMSDRPIQSPKWGVYTIVGPVAADADSITVRVVLRGQGTAWADDLSLDTVPAPPPPEGPRELSKSGLANEIAFARLLGYVRFFHPSDEAAATDWPSFALAGVRRVESATGAAQLAAVLDSLFRPIAPTLVVRAGAAAPARTLAAPQGAREVVTWRHFGVGLGAGQSVYRSDRIRAVLGSGALPDSFPDPARPLAVELGGGVTALLPLAVYADSAGTLPRGRAAAPAEERLPPSSYDGDDRGTRLADVALAWTVLQHFYPYFDLTGTDWSAQLPLALRNAATDRDGKAFETTLRRMVAALHDGHGNATYRGLDRMSRPRVLLRRVEGKVVVVAVDSSEKRLRLGDVILAVDGQPVTKVLAQSEPLISSATPQWLEWRAVSGLLSGPAGTKVRVDVAHVDGSRDSVTLARVPSGGTLAEVRPKPVTELKPGIWYVDMGRATDQQVEAVMPQLAAARGLIFDMRGYPQLNTARLLPHLSRTRMTSAQWHIPVTMQPDRRATRFAHQGDWDMPPGEPYLAAPRVFLTDGRAISYAESTMGIVEAYHLGEIVGSPTAGTNGNVNPLGLPGGYSISWTGMKVLKHDGSRHHGVGIRPTVPLEPTINGVAAGRDEVLERAVQMLER